MRESRRERKKLAKGINENSKCQKVFTIEYYEIDLIIIERVEVYKYTTTRAKR